MEISKEYVQPPVRTVFWYHLPYLSHFPYSCYRIKHTRELTLPKLMRQLSINFPYNWMKSLAGKFFWTDEKLSNLFNITFKCAYWNWGHPDIENQSDGRTETIDTNILKSSQSNVWYKAKQWNLTLFAVMLTRLQTPFQLCFGMWRNASRGIKNMAA